MLIIESEWKLDKICFFLELLKQKPERIKRPKLRNWGNFRKFKKKSLNIDRYKKYFLNVQKFDKHIIFA
jgi:hypothetical protein